MAGLENLSPEEFERRRIKNLEELAASNLQLGQLQGRVRGAFEVFRTDPIHGEMLRAREWLKARPELHVTFDGSKVDGLPDGWPDGVDGEELIDQDVDARANAYIERAFGRTEQTEATSIESSPSVKRWEGD